MEKTKKVVGGDDWDEARAPYMGMVGVRNRSGSRYLHGSDVQHSQTIALFVSEGVEIRHLNENRYRDGKKIVEIEMTPLQWLELITNPNTGCGTPCTLRYTETSGMIAAPEKLTVEIDKAQTEFKARLENLPEQLKELQKTVNELKITKKAKDDLTRQIDRMQMEIGPNMRFAFDQFKEATEHLLGEAKATAETYLNNALFRLGLRTAKTLEAKQLEDANTPQIEE